MYLFYQNEAFQQVCLVIWQLSYPPITVDWDSLLELKERRSEVINLSGSQLGRSDLRTSIETSRGSRETRSLHLFYHNGGLCLSKGSLNFRCELSLDSPFQPCSEKNLSMNQLFELQGAHFEIIQIFPILFVKCQCIEFLSKSDLTSLQAPHLLRCWPDWPDWSNC